MSRATRSNYLQRMGFLPSEAKTLSRTSRRGMLAPYFQAMIQNRHALLLNAKRYHWTAEEFRQRIKDQYVKSGAVKQDAMGRRVVDVFKRLRMFEDRTPIPDEYTSPWRKKIDQKSTIKREKKRATRYTMIADRIADAKRKLAKTENPYRREALERDIANWEKMEQELKKRGIQ